MDAVVGGLPRVFFFAGYWLSPFALLLLLRVVVDFRLLWEDSSGVDLRLLLLYVFIVVRWCVVLFPYREREREKGLARSWPRSWPRKVLGKAFFFS